MRVTAFTKYDSLAASTRQRLLQYRPYCEAAGIEVDHRPLLGQDYVRSLATGGGYSRLEVAQAYMERLRELLLGPVGDVIWIYAELFPYLPAAFEKLAIRRGKPIVYDFDDAFFHTYDQSARALVRRFLGGKLEPLLKSAAACSCGNEYLREYALHFCPSSIVIPTVVDTGTYRPRGDETWHGGPPVIGWIGSPSTWSYMRPLLPLLAQLAKEGRARIRVVGAGPKAKADQFAGMELVEWSEASEVNEVQQMDIGIMPLPDEPWARGKSGFKLIQYMACGLPVVASPVGVNNNVISAGANGFLAANLAEWHSALKTLLDEVELRRRLGGRGRQIVEEHYSLAAHAPRFVQLLHSVAGLGPRPI